MAELEEIDVEDLADRIEDGSCIIVDVREADEYAEGHVAGAVLVPMSELEGRVDDVPAGVPVMLICQTGARSRRCGEFLLAQGRDVSNVIGGTRAWIMSGRDVVEGTEPT